MKPEDFRQLLLKPDTKLGLLGNWYPDLNHRGLIEGTLASYIAVERHHNHSDDWRQETIVWDAAVVMLPSIQLQGTVDDKQEYLDELLLLHRFPNFAWDNSDPVVHVFGVKRSESLPRGALARSIWQPKTVWLESRAVMTVEDPVMPSEMSQFFRSQVNND
jgi:hypothetical protein